MAVNDAEIKIGVSLDSDQFTNAYKDLLAHTSQTTQNFISNALSPENMKGAAAKDWGHLPFVDMHNPTAGNITASQAFMASMADDLKTMGIRRGSLGYQSAMLSAAYKSSIPDPMERYHRLLSEGVAYYQADEVYPTTALSKAIESNYALMEQDWSRDFIKTKKRKGVTSQYIDFAGMRDYAVEHGLGQWIDGNGEHTADNFELIGESLEDITESAGDIGDGFREWGENLKSVLGTITAIGGALIKIGATAAGLVIGATVKSEKGVLEGAASLDNRRAFVGMSALDVLSAQVASQSVGLGKDAITNEVINLSNSREKYKLLGEGLNALFPSLTGVFDNIMSSDNPLDVYKGILKEVYGNLKNADTSTRSQALMLLESQGLGSASQIIGAFLSNPKLAKELGNDPTALFSLKNNSYYGAYERAETMVPELTQLNTSIKASYQQLYDDWTETFGKPFKKWWDDVLKNKVVPWFEKFTYYVTRSEQQKELDTLHHVTTSPVTRLERDELIEAQSANAYVRGYKGTTKVAPLSDWNTWLQGDMSAKQNAKAVRNQWDLYERIAGKTDKDIASLGLKKNETAVVTNFRDRVKYIVDRMNETGLSGFLTNSTLQDVDKYFLEAMQLTASGSWSTDAFNNYINKVLSGSTQSSEMDNLMLEQLKKIAANTEGKEAVMNDTAFWKAVANLWGEPTAKDWQTAVNRQ